MTSTSADGFRCLAERSSTICLSGIVFGGKGQVRDEGAGVVVARCVRLVCTAWPPARNRPWGRWLSTSVRADQYGWAVDYATPAICRRLYDAGRIRLCPVSTSGASHKAGCGSGGYVLW